MIIISSDDDDNDNMVEDDPFIFPNDSQQHEANIAMDNNNITMGGST